MVTSCSSSELVDILAKRFGTLEIIAEQPMTQTELSERMSVSRTTTHRVIKTFEEFNLVQQQQGIYELTEFGQQIYRSHNEYLDTLDRNCQLEAIRRELSADISLNSPILEGAEAVLNEPHTIDSPVYKNREIIESAVRVHTVLDGVMFDYLNAHRAETTNEDVVMIVPDHIVDSVLKTYEEPVRDLLQSDHFELHRTSQPVPLSVTIAETPDYTCAILLSHSGGSIYGTVRNTSQEAVKWARDRFQQYLNERSEYDTRSKLRSRVG